MKILSSFQTGLNLATCRLIIVLRHGMMQVGGYERHVIL